MKNKKYCNKSNIKLNKSKDKSKDKLKSNNKNSLYKSNNKNISEANNKIYNTKIINKSFNNNTINCSNNKLNNNYYNNKISNKIKNFIEKKCDSINLKSNILLKLEEMDLEEPVKRPLLKQYSNKSIDNVSSLKISEDIIYNNRINLIKQKYNKEFIKSNNIYTINNNNSSNNNNNDKCLMQVNISKNIDESDNLNPNLNQTVIKYNKDNISQQILNNNFNFKNELINGFDNNYQHKINQIKQNELQENKVNNSDLNSNKSLINKIKINNKYNLGVNKDSNIVYNKFNKWIGYIQNCNIVIESIEEDNCNQLILSSAKTDNNNIKSNNINLLPINKIILSNNNKLLLGYSTKNGLPNIIIWNVENIILKNKYCNNIETINENNINFNNINQNNYKLINSMTLAHNKIHSVLFSSNDLFLIISSSLEYNCNNKNNNSFVSILDFYKNEIISTSYINSAPNIIEFNFYVKNFEFVTIDTKKKIDTNLNIRDANYNTLIFWRINTEYTLQNQEVNINYYINKLQKEQIKTTLLEAIFITSVAFSPPMGIASSIFLFVGLSNGDLIGIDSKVNSVVFSTNINNLFYNTTTISSSNKFFYDRIKLNCGLKHLFINNKHKLMYIKLNTNCNLYINNNNYCSNEKNSLEIFENCYKEEEFDSDIKFFDYDCINSNGLVYTKTGSIYFVDFTEDIFNKLHTLSPIFYKDTNKIYNNEDIVDVLIIDKCHENNFANNYNIRNTYNIEKTNTIVNTCYYIIVCFKKGLINIWNYPNIHIIQSLETINEEIICTDKLIDDCIVAVSYITGYIRVFNNSNYKDNSSIIKDTTVFNFVGKFRCLDEDDYYKSIKFTSDKNFILCMSNNNKLLLIKIESYLNFQVVIHKNIIEFDFEVNMFDISLPEPFSKFCISNNIGVYFYSRKYTNILKNLSFDNSIPQYYLYDKVNYKELYEILIEDYNTTKNLDININNNIVKLCKHNIGICYIIVTSASKLVIRNFNYRSILKVFDICYNNLCNLNENKNIQENVIVKYFEVSNNFNNIFILYDNNFLLSLRFFKKNNFNNNINDIYDNIEINLRYNELIKYNKIKKVGNSVINFSNNGKHVVFDINNLLVLNEIEFE